MDLLLRRRLSSGVSTIGDLCEIVHGVAGPRLCYICEDIIREEPGVPVTVWKVAGKTAIPQGHYSIIVTESARFHRPLPLLEDVPGFTGIRIHPGNTAADTDGCLLPGLITDGVQVYHSKQAFDDLYQRIVTALANDEAVVLTILNAIEQDEAA